MELDFWIPNLNIGIEYQGEYHYYQVIYLLILIFLNIYFNI